MYKLPGFLNACIRDMLACAPSSCCCTQGIRFKRFPPVLYIQLCPHSALMGC